MSRASREKRITSAHRWPALAGSLGSHFGQHFWMKYDSFESARKALVDALDHPGRKQVATEWRDWNARAGAVDDIRKALAHLGVEPPFDTAADARKFMNQVYDALIVAIRAKAPGWKPGPATA
jgi:hypothetical protein